MRTSLASRLVRPGLLALLCLLGATPAWSQWRIADADAWLKEAAPNENHGSDQELSVKNTPADSFRTVFFFDLSDIPVGANVTDAELRLRVTGEDDTGDQVNIYRMTDSWTESTVNWANTGNDYDATSIWASFVPDSEGWQQIDLTALVQAWVCGTESNDGLMLIATSDDTESKYASREWSVNGQRPRLRVQTSGVATCPTAAVEVASYDLEESAWIGAPDEVLDGTANLLHGIARGGAMNDSASPAIPTDPGTCRYGDFDGIDDYIEIADDALLDLQSGLTVAAWINARTIPGSGLHTIVSKDWNFEFHVNDSGQIYWWWNDSGGTTRTLTSASSISTDQWYHVAITYQSGSQVIYIDGQPAATSSFSGQLRVNDLPLFIGTDWNFISRAFDGFIDEVVIYDGALAQPDIDALMTATHPCPVAAAEFTINHDGFGIHCVAETITVDVIDSIAGTPLTSYNASVQLDTQTGNGSWSLVSGSGTLTDAVADDGIAVYDWPLNESQAQFSLSYTQGTPIFDIDVFQISDTGIRDTDAEGPIEFSANGFTLTAVPLSNPPPGVIVPFAQTQVAAVPFTIAIAAYGQTANDPVCGIIESYTGNKNLKFWSSYLNPGSGSRAVDIDTNPIATTEAGSANQTVVFTNGQAVVSAKYKDVGSLQVAVKDDSTINAELPLGIRGATAGFVSQPDSFEISALADAGGSVPNPEAVDHNDNIFIAAGAPFRATVTALDAEGDATPNYGQESVPETVRLESVLIGPVGGQNPPVSAATGFGAFSGGSATGLDFVWPEVGIIRLRPAIGDADYLGTGDVVGNDSVNLGRFVPADFALAQNTPSFATQCAAGSFTYTGQVFGYAVAPTIVATARAVGGSTTLNYTGDYFKLATNTLANRVYSWTGGTLDLSGLPPTTADPAVSETAPGQATIVFSAGSGLFFSRAAIEAPFNADIELTIDVVDGDSIAASANPATFGGIGGIDFTSGREIRYGRIRFVNAVGSELVNLPVPLRAEYLAGPALGFVPNVQDSCTTGVTLSLGPYTENLSPGETCALDTGSPGVSGVGCPAPAPLGQQFNATAAGGDFNLILQAPGQNNHGGVRIDAAVPSWLQFDWNAAAPGNENPSGQATFGLFGGDASQIYLREVY